MRSAQLQQQQKENPQSRFGKSPISYTSKLKLALEKVVNNQAQDIAATKDDKGLGIMVEHPELPFNNRKAGTQVNTPDNANNKDKGFTQGFKQNERRKVTVGASQDRRSTRNNSRVKQKTKDEIEAEFMNELMQLGRSSQKSNPQNTEENTESFSNLKVKLETETPRAYTRRSQNIYGTSYKDRSAFEQEENQSDNSGFSGNKSDTNSNNTLQQKLENKKRKLKAEEYVPDYSPKPITFSQSKPQLQIISDEPEAKQLQAKSSQLFGILNEPVITLSQAQDQSPPTTTTQVQFMVKSTPRFQLENEEDESGNNSHKRFLFRDQDQDQDEGDKNNDNQIQKAQVASIVKHLPMLDIIISQKLELSQAQVMMKSSTSEIDDHKDAQEDTDGAAANAESSSFMSRFDFIRQDLRSISKSIGHSETNLAQMSIDDISAVDQTQDNIRLVSNNYNNEGSFYLRKDLLDISQNNDRNGNGDDTRSDHTFKSALNKFQSYNNSMILPQDDISNGQNTPANQASNIKIYTTENCFNDHPKVQNAAGEDHHHEIEVLKTEEGELEQEQAYKEWRNMVGEAQQTLSQLDSQAKLDKEKARLQGQQNKNSQVQDVPIQRTYLRKLVRSPKKYSASAKNSKDYDADNQQFILAASSSHKNNFLNSENPELLENNILFLILIGKKNFHSYIISDQEINRCRIFFKNLIDKSSECHEAFFGLAKIYFHLNKFEISLDCIKKAIKIRDRDPLYFLWKGLIHLYQAYKLNPKSVATLYLLLKLTLYLETQKTSQFLDSPTKNSSQDYALKIDKADKYLGYVAWSEIYLSQASKKDLGVQVLEDLVQNYPNNPQAYLRLWNQYYLSNQKGKALELAERLFIFGTGYSSYEIKIIIALLYAKSLYINHETVRCFELLQSEYINFPHYTSLLYAYSKYIIHDYQCLVAANSQKHQHHNISSNYQSNYVGSAIGALEECMRCCVRERHSKINYYLGKASLLRGQGMGAYEYWVAIAGKQGTTNSAALLQMNQLKRKEITKYIDQYRSAYTLLNVIEKQVSLKLAGKRVRIAQEEARECISQIQSKFSQLDRGRFTLIQGQVEAYILLDQERACSIFVQLTRDLPYYIEGYAQYWRYLKHLKQYGKMRDVAEQAVRVSECSSSVATSMWVEARIILAKTLLIEKQVAQAIATLRQISFILPPFPIQGLTYVDHMLVNQDFEVENNNAANSTLFSFTHQKLLSNSRMEKTGDNLQLLKHQQTQNRQSLMNRRSVIQSFVTDPDQNILENLTNHVQENHMNDQDGLPSVQIQNGNPNDPYPYSATGTREEDTGGVPMWQRGDSSVVSAKQHNSRIRRSMVGRQSLAGDYFRPFLNQQDDSAQTHNDNENNQIAAAVDQYDDDEQNMVYFATEGDFVTTEEGSTPIKNRVNNINAFESIPTNRPRVPPLMLNNHNRIGSLNINFGSAFNQSFQQSQTARIYEDNEAYNRSLQQNRFHVSPSLTQHNVAWAEESKQDHTRQDDNRQSEQHVNEDDIRVANYNTTGGVFDSFNQINNRGLMRHQNSVQSQADHWQAYKSNNITLENASQYHTHQQQSQQQYHQILSQSFAVYSNVKFLYQIGKICCETGTQLEDGLKALNDYQLIMEYFRWDMKESKFEEVRIKTNYCIGLIFYKSKDYEACKKYLCDILLDLKENGHLDKFEVCQEKIGKIYRRESKQIINNYFQ